MIGAAPLRRLADATRGETVAPTFAMPHGTLRVEIADAARFATLSAQWDDLVRRAAEPNPFLHPAVVAAVARRPVVVLAWAGNRLDGVWAFTARKPSPHLPLPLLHAPLHFFTLLATPVVDAARVREVLAAMLDAIAAAPGLPNIVDLEMTGADGPVFDALTALLAERRSGLAVVQRTMRPKLDAATGGEPLAALSASSRKKLRQHRRRLEKEGVVTLTHHQGSDVSIFLEEFLAMEARGWKGRGGTAVAADAAAARFTRAALGALGEAGDASIMTLRLDGQPLAIQLILRCGPAAFTWKTAYDETWASFSPGMLLFEACTAAFMADDTLSFVDSCCHDAEGYMASGWPERQKLVQVMFDARPGRRHRLRIAAALEHNRLKLRAGAKRLYHRARAMRRG